VNVPSFTVVCGRYPSSRRARSIDEIRRVFAPQSLYVHYADTRKPIDLVCYVNDAAFSSCNRRYRSLG